MQAIITFLSSRHPPWMPATLSLLSRTSSPVGQRRLFPVPHMTNSCRNLPHCVQQGARRRLGPEPVRRASPGGRDQQDAGSRDGQGLLLRRAQRCLFRDVTIEWSNLSFAWPPWIRCSRRLPGRGTAALDGEWLVGHSRSLEYSFWLALHLTIRN